MKGEVMLHNDHSSKYFLFFLALAILFLLATNPAVAKKTNGTSPPEINIKAPREGEHLASQTLT
jgi:hypothetical protein